eukprot:scaffold613_cov243-Pinguiococcus_pyrenoidosus.AAC.15
MARRAKFEVPAAHSASPLSPAYFSRVTGEVHLEKASRSRDGSPESSGLQARLRGKPLGESGGGGPKRAPAQAGDGDHRLGQGPISASKPSGDVRMQVVPHAAPERGQLPGAHPRATASEQSGQEGTHGERGQPGAAHGDESQADSQHDSHRPAGVQGDQVAGSADAAKDADLRD